MKSALLLTTYNRPELLQRCLDSLAACDLLGVTHIIVVDDCSTDPKTREILTKHLWFRPVINRWHSTNMGIKQALMTGCEIAFEHLNCDVVINLDADAIVSKNFADQLLLLKRHYPDHIVSGFNCDHPQNPVLKEFESLVFRKHCNGINMVFNRQQYETIILPALKKAGNWDFNSTNSKPFVIAKPSLVQHIGLNQSTMGHTGGDIACDFKAVTLDRVCLFGIDAHDPQGLLTAAEICERDIRFGAKRIITEKLFTGREAYSRWMIESLHEHLPEGSYSHVLIIHPDGYVQNPSAWNDDWLQYDYIGASWWYKDGKNVGNGGFSLRSRKLIQVCSQLDLNRYHPEDAVICRDLRPWLESTYGIKFAPQEVADRFSIEAYAVPRPDNAYSGQFGAHGYHCTGLPVPMPRRAFTGGRVPVVKKR